MCIVVFDHTREVGETQRAHPTGEGWKILDNKMHRNLDMKDSESMQGQSIIESLPLMLIIDCSATDGQ